jgi:hypothetical protein
VQVLVQVLDDMVSDFEVVRKGGAAATSDTVDLDDEETRYCIL